MNPANLTDRQTAQGRLKTKPTMLELWRKHPTIQTVAMIEAPGIPFVRVVSAFCGYPMTQQEFDAVLKALNCLTGCHYTQDDIAGVEIAPGGDAPSLS